MKSHFPHHLKKIMKRVSAIAGLQLQAQRRNFFGKGWDNAALDTIFKSVLRKPSVNDKLRTSYVSFLDGRDADSLRRLGDLARQNKNQVRIFLAPHLGDAHRLLKCYSLTAYPILGHDGSQLMVELDGHSYGAFADPDDDFSKVVIPQLDEVKYLAQELLATMKWESSPAGAASLLESLYRGAEIPDHVFQTPAVIERVQTKEGAY